MRLDARPVSVSLPTPAPGDAEQEGILTTKTPKAPGGDLSPSKGYTVQIFKLTGSGNALLAQREFVHKAVTCTGDLASERGCVGGADPGGGGRSRPRASP